tara:strand:- start:549 stop:917 length:369 start_codon:yes stop_codon:yes gene_type:complete
VSSFLIVPPSQRVLIPGEAVSSQLQMLNGDQHYVRQSNATLNHTLTLSYAALTNVEVFSLVSHYVLNGVFYGFDLPSEATQGMTLSIPSGYLWRYAAAPECESSASSTSASVELVLKPPSLT